MKKEEIKHPYMRRLFWSDKRNHFWNDGTYTKEFIAKQNKWVKEVTKVNCGNIF